MLRAATALLACILLLVGATSAQAAGVPKRWERGFTFTSWWNDSYGTRDAARSLDQLADTGANAVSVIAVWYQPSLRSSRMRRAEATTSDAALATVVRRARRHRLDVSLRLMAESAGGGWRGDFDPRSPRRWFAAYRRMVIHYARFAERHHVDTLEIGSEYCRRLDKARYDSRWRSIIRSARARFDGRLTYGACWHDFDEVRWWDALDVIGVDAYPPLATGPTPTEDEIVAAWHDFTDEHGNRRRYIDRLEEAHRRFHKPVIFTELGYPSTVRTLVSPQWHGWTTGFRYSARDQQRAFAAAFRALRGHRWFRGVYVWQWSWRPDQGGRGDLDHTPQNKPAERTIARWFRRSSRR